jgi:hypothetical protein
MFIFEIANLGFRGAEVTEKVTANGIVYRTDKVRVLFDDLECTLQQIDDYDERINTIENGGWAVTARLTIRSLTNRELGEKASDDLADALCELLSFATKNTVYWLRRTRFDAAGRMEMSVTRQHIVGKLRPYRSGWSLIPGYAAVDEHWNRCEFSYFLNSVFPQYVNKLRAGGLQSVIWWIIDSEHQTTVDMMYISAYIAIERLRAKFLKRDALPVMMRHDWVELLQNGLFDDITTTVEKRLGGLSDPQKRALFGVLRNANNPPAAVELDALCKQIGVTGFEKEMNELRNKLVHTGTYGDFEFPDAIRLWRTLSHIIDLCVLKLLDYDGKYHHLDTDWIPKKLDKQSQPAVA